ncbi:hypothetical protein QTP81_09600 [Alteromonas sp. ASW11-36]|uniref:Uncharacterized protein n=1 Tax=Alteromonas arenosi TaxID=3055817 RepID=A0ABT7SZ91_9ALTE|nr:hypothetical protein [Alteromonas sp. ASW11-36]MDM7860849.1 hypothetical protein [Alteromonas sp. ASW11-36]
MPYEIHVNDNHVLIRLTEVVTSIDLLKSLEDIEFLNCLEKTGVAVYDYSDAKESLVTIEDAAHLAHVANKMVEYQPSLKVIIIPLDPNKLEKAHAYESAITNPKVSVHICKSLKQLDEVLNNQ